MLACAIVALIGPDVAGQGTEEERIAALETQVAALQTTVAGLSNTPPTTSQPTMQTASHTIRGTITLIGQPASYRDGRIQGDIDSDENGNCTGYGGFDDIRAGASVVV